MSVASERPLRILYVTSWVLGDAGANAAELFPAMAVADDRVQRVIVADLAPNQAFIESRQGADYLRVGGRLALPIAGFRIARAARDERVDVIHVFYRQLNAILLIFIRLGLRWYGAPAQIVMDHRSINLSKGMKRWRKLRLNAVMQRFTHHLAGNPWAVETNHARVRKPAHIIDLGYDQLPPSPPDAAAAPTATVAVWYVGSMKPVNRKADFLLDVFDRLAEQAADRAPRLEFHVAGPATAAQEARLRANPCVIYHGTLPRSDLYSIMQAHPGLGIAYMNREFHDYAPSLKFVEYAAMRFTILASDTEGLRTQAERMGLTRVRFVEETVRAWIEAILTAAKERHGPEPAWKDAERWSYRDIFDRQVMTLYRQIAPPEDPA